MKGKAHSEIYETLQKRIVEMEYAPGQPLSEKELVEEFGVSRTPVREALLRLAQSGLIEMVPRVGTFVTRIEPIMVRHAFEVKKNLEGLAAELASQRATDEEIEELFEIIRRFDEYDIVKDYKSCIQDDQRFHRIVRQASRNPILIDTLEQLNIKTARFLQSIRYIIDDYDWFSASLREMAEAIRNRDRDEARRSTEVHTEAFLIQLSQKFFNYPL